jgi:hypothetical protein
MQVIMIGNWSLVFIIDLGKELKEFVVVNSLQQIVLFQEGGSDHGHLHVSTDGLCKVKYVEIERIYLIIPLVMLLNEWFYVLCGQIKVDSVGIDLLLNIREV